MLQDVFDVPALQEVLRGIEARTIRVHEVETPAASPFARSLVFAYVAAYLYEGDSPAAERRAQALSLDMKLLRELLGEADLRELLDAAVIAELEALLQRRTEKRRARHPDELHDLLRQLGNLTVDQIRERSEADPEPWMRELEQGRRSVQVRVAGREAWIAVEDAGLYRDALGVAPPAGVAEAFLALVERPLEALLERWARTHRPFGTDRVAERFGLVPEHARLFLLGLARAGKVRRGYFVEGLGGAQFAYPGVVDRLRRVSDESADVSEVVTLAATDPANPYGWLLPWPDVAGEDGSDGTRPLAVPRRAAGAVVVLVGGGPVLYLDRAGRRLRTFASAGEEELARALTELPQVARTRPRRALALERVDGDPATRSGLTPLLRAAGFREEYRFMWLTVG